MIKIFKLALITSAMAGLFLRPLYAMEERQTPVGQDSPDMRLSDLPDEIKQNILGKLDNQSLARVKRVDKEWNNQANDPQLTKKNEAYYLRLAFQAGIVTLYSKKDSWADTYANRNNKDWIFSRFKEAIKEFSNDDRIEGIAAITLDNVMRLIDSGKTPEEILDYIKQILAGYKRQNANKTVKMDNLSYHSTFGASTIDELAEAKNVQAQNYLKVYKNVASAYNLDWQEALVFFATYKVPILVQPKQIAATMSEAQLIPVNPNDEKVKNARVASAFLSVVRQFAKHYERLVTLENRDQGPNVRK